MVEPGSFIYNQILSKFPNVFSAARRPSPLVGSRLGDACASVTCDMRNVPLTENDFQCIHCGTQLHGKCAADRVRLIEARLSNEEKKYTTICPNESCSSKLIRTGKQLADNIRIPPFESPYRSAKDSMPIDENIGKETIVTTQSRISKLAGALDAFVSNGDLDIKLCMDVGSKPTLPAASRFACISVPGSNEMSHRMGARVVAMQLSVCLETRPGRVSETQPNDTDTEYDAGAIKDVFHIVGETRRHLILPQEKGHSWSIYKDVVNPTKNKSFFFHQMGMGRVDVASSGIGKVMKSRSVISPSLDDDGVDPQYVEPFKPGDKLEFNGTSFDAMGTEFCIYVPGADEIRAILSGSPMSNSSDEAKQVEIAPSFMDFRVRARLGVVLEKSAPVKGRPTPSTSHPNQRTHVYYYASSSAIELPSIPPKGDMDTRSRSSGLVSVERFMEPPSEGLRFGNDSLDIGSTRIVCDHVPLGILRRCVVPRDSLKLLFSSDASLHKKEAPSSGVDRSIRSGTRVFQNKDEPCVVCGLQSVDPVESMADPAKILAALRAARLPKKWSAHAYCWMMFLKSLQEKSLNESLSVTDVAMDEEDDKKIDTLALDRVSIPENITREWFDFYKSKKLTDRLRDPGNCQNCYIRRPLKSTLRESKRFCRECKDIAPGIKVE